MSVSNDLTEDQARKLGATFQRLSEQAETQYREYRDALVKALKDYQYSDQAWLIVPRSHLEIIVAQAERLKLIQSSLSKNEREGTTVEYAYEYGDDLYEFLSRQDLTFGLAKFGADIQRNGVVLTEKKA